VRPGDPGAPAIEFARQDICKTSSRPLFGPILQPSIGSLKIADLPRIRKNYVIDFRGFTAVSNPCTAD
jgi:hypothetical protein